MLNLNIIDTYSKVHIPVTYTNSTAISFEGSQKQQEFFTAWKEIEEYYIQNPTAEISFLEIGAYKGLWGIAFSEFCKMYSIKGTYVTLTMMDQDPNNRPLLNTLSYLDSVGIETNLVDMNSLDSEALLKVQKIKETYDIVFIDASHKYSDVVSDIENFASLAGDILIFHDIRPKKTTADIGVYQALVDTGTFLDEEILANELEMGIGIKYIK